MNQHHGRKNNKIIIQLMLLHFLFKCLFDEYKAEKWRSSERQKHQKHSLSGKLGIGI